MKMTGGNFSDRLRQKSDLLSQISMNNLPNRTENVPVNTMRKLYETWLPQLTTSYRRNVQIPSAEERSPSPSEEDILDSGRSKIVTAAKFHQPNKFRVVGHVVETVGFMHKGKLRCPPIVLGKHGPKGSILSKRGSQNSIDSSRSVQSNSKKGLKRRSSNQGCVNS